MERFARLGAGVAVLLVVCGCGAATTAPAPPGETSGAQETTGRGAREPIGGILGALPRLVNRIVDLAGDLGASVENGRWSLDVPAGAIEGGARITLGVTYAKSGECTMEVVPSDKNKFEVPALVTVDCAALTDEQLAQSVILEYDPATRRWSDVPGSVVDASHRNVSALVDHVARYTVGPAGGKAGW